MSKNILIIVFLIFSNSIFAQTRVSLNDFGIFPKTYNKNYGKITIVSDSKLQELIKNHIKHNKNKPEFPGWRVQIYFGSGNQARGVANNIKKNFMNSYKKTEAYLLYEAPYFKIRVGDFRKRNEALKFMKNIKSDYPNSWIVEDLINFPKLD